MLDYFLVDGIVLPFLAGLNDILLDWRVVNLYSPVSVFLRFWPETCATTTTLNIHIYADLCEPRYQLVGHLQEYCW